jgi:hypothetical protein
MLRHGGAHTTGSTALSNDDSSALTDDGCADACCAADTPTTNIVARQTIDIDTRTDS